jgi:hypothetical protein
MAVICSMRTLIVLVLSAVPAFAADAPARVEVSAAACAALAGPDYVPGIDVHGNGVAPADLPDSGNASAVGTDTLSIEIDPHIAGQFGIPPRGTGAYGTRPVLGYVTVAGGKAYFNGKPLSPEAAEGVAAGCRAAGRK